MRREKGSSVALLCYAVVQISRTDTLCVCVCERVCVCSEEAKTCVRERKKMRKQKKKKKMPRSGKPGKCRDPGRMLRGQARGRAGSQLLRTMNVGWWAVLTGGRFCVGGGSAVSYNSRYDICLFSTFAPREAPLPVRYWVTHDGKTDKISAPRMSTLNCVRMQRPVELHNHSPTANHKTHSRNHDQHHRHQMT